MAHPRVFCGSDTSNFPDKRFDPESVGGAHPRSYGTMVRRLELVRDFRLRTMEESVKNLTRDTAQALGLGQRGLLQEGWPADITVLDYDRCHAAADYVHPRRRSTGIHWVLVNGVVKLWGTPAMTDEVATYILTMVGQFFGLMLISMALLLLSLPVVLRYSMADYVLCENPEVGALGALRESRRMMKGNKWRLFCLQFSFIGWRLLASVVGSIGYIFLNPYLEQANAEFYHEISGRAAVREAVNELDAPMADLT
jgi:hypothetical protein